MRNTIILTIIAFFALFLILPNGEQPKTDTENDDSSENNELSNKLTLETTHHMATISGTQTKRNEGRYWGKLNQKQWMVYEGMDNIIYVQGKFHQVSGEWRGEKYWINISDLENLFNLKHLNQSKYKLNGSQNTSKVNNQDRCKAPKEILDKLKDPNMPIKNAQITEVSGQLPGAPREYRNGYHEGFDWYSQAIGRTISKNTDVYPIYKGKIVRIDKSFEELDKDKRKQLLDDAKELGRTPEDTLDKLRGRQIWIQSDNNVLVRYAHLSEVNSKLSVGQRVNSNMWIAKTGNSGTSNGSLHNDQDVHLHTDILVCGKNFWEYGDKDTMIQNLIDIFNH